MNWIKNSSLIVSNSRGLSVVFLQCLDRSQLDRHESCCKAGCIWWKIKNHASVILTRLCWGEPDDIYCILPLPHAFRCLSIHPGKVQDKCGIFCHRRRKTRCYIDPRRCCFLRNSYNLPNILCCSERFSVNLMDVILEANHTPSTNPNSHIPWLTRG